MAAMVDFWLEWFCYFWSTSQPNVQKKKQKKIFKMAASVAICGGHLGFPIGMIFAIFDLKVTPMLPTKFQLSRHFGSEEEVTAILDFRSECF